MNPNNLDNPLSKQEEIKVRQKEDTAKDEEKKKSKAEYDAKYYAKNKEKIKRREAKYRAKNKKKKAVYGVKYRAKNKVKMAENRVKNIKVHPEKYKDMPLRLYASIVLKPEILKRDNYTCQMCENKADKLFVHHIIPVKFNGPITELTNLITLCKGCHKKAHEGWKSFDPVWAELALEHLR